MKSVTKKEKIEYLIIAVLLMILVAEAFAIRDVRVESREQQAAAVSERIYLKHNTKLYDVPFNIWVDGTGDANRIHKLESIVSEIKSTDPEMYRIFVNTGWHFVLTDKKLGENKKANTKIVGQCNPLMKCLYILNVDDRVVWHEFAHFVDNTKDTSKTKVFKKAHKNEWMETTDAYDLLTVNTATAGEYFAEMYSFFRVNGIPADDACPMTKDVFRKLFNN